MKNNFYQRLKDVKNAAIEHVRNFLDTKPEKRYKFDECDVYWVKFQTDKMDTVEMGILQEIDKNFVTLNTVYAKNTKVSYDDLVFGEIAYIIDQLPD